MTVQDSDKFLVNRSNSSYQIEAQNMAELQDTDLMLVNRGGVSYKATGKEIKDSLAPANLPPTINSISLAGGPGFSGKSYVTTLDAFEGVPAASKSMKAKVTGELSVAGETSPITGVDDSSSVDPPTATLTATGDFGTVTLPTLGNLKNVRISVAASGADSYPQIGFSPTSFSGTAYKSDQGGHYFNAILNGIAIIGLYAAGPAFDGSSTSLKYLDDGTTVEMNGDYELEYVYNSAGQVWVKYAGRFCYCGNNNGPQDPVAGTNCLFSGVADGHYIGVLMRTANTAVVNSPQVTLTLTDATDLDNGAFVVDDVVTGYTQDGPTAAFAPVIYTGNGGTQSITTGFAPDLVWIKQRTANGINQHVLMDTVRGTNEMLCSNATTEASAFGNPPAYGYVSSFNADGFTVTGGSSDATQVNGPGSDYVAWCWKASGSTVTNNEGSVESQVRAGNGFSICKYQGDGGTGKSFGHSLGVAPSFVLVKSLNQGYSWSVYHAATGTDYLQLNSADEAKTSSEMWGSVPTASVVNVNGSINTSGAGVDYVAYCWAETPGVSSFGNYAGTSGSTTPEINCGFEPAFVLIKAISAAGSWVMYDAARDSAQNGTKWLYANTNAAEVEGVTYKIEISNTGFTPVGSSAENNGAGVNYIYVAFAEGEPPVTVKAISTTAAQMTVSGGDWENGQTVKNTVVNPITGVPKSDVITDFAAGPNRPWDLSVIASTGYVLSNNDTTLTRQNGSISFVSLDGVTIGPSETKTFTFSHTNLSNDPAPIYTTVVNKDPSDSADRGGYIDTKTEGWAIRIQDNAVLFYKAEELQRIDATPYNPTNGATNEFMFEISRDGTYQIWKFKNQTTGYTASYTFNDTHAGDVYMAFTSNNYDQTVTSGPGDSVLTLASSDGLANFGPGYDVYQDSGYTAETSAITNIFDDRQALNVTGARNAAVAEALQEARNPNGTPMSTVVNPDGSLSATEFPGVFSPSGIKITYDPPIDLSSSNGVFNVYGGAENNSPENYTIRVDFSDGDAVNVQGVTAPNNWIMTRQYTRPGQKILSVSTTGSTYSVIMGVTLGDNNFIVSGGAVSLSFEDATDLDVFEPGDVITGYTQTDISVTGQTTGTNTIDKFITAWNSSGGSGNFFLDTTIPGNYVEFGVPSAGTLILKGGRTSLIDVDITATGDFTGGDRDFVWTGGDTSQTFQFTGAGVVRLTVTNSSNGIYVNGVDSTFNGSTFSLGTPVTVVSVKDPDLGAPYQMTVDGGTWTEDAGQTVSCTYEAGTGTVAGTSGSTMTLSTADNAYPKRWVANAGKFVTGDPTAIKSMSVFLEFTGSTVDGTSPTDPGFTPAPANLTLTFNDANNPSGRTWDQDFPAGTKIETQVRLTNDSAPGGVDSGWSNEVTALKLSTDLSEQELQQAYAETAASLLSHKNRGDYRTGQEAVEKRADLRIKMSDLGLTTDLVDEPPKKNGRKKKS